ncbi:MAG: prepilin-type N-terminal cleavage/methylation domain-containing protein [Planctomycetota bacterium]|jgi:prepilin-type N-terminal cleavage/methylation domain-containing protein/prepilin-type processing-associated H-X9-DG protein|nr:prepilin-type N-terminal cleavage/methylation domain-containing protein [Planctomycetota bacterium]
MTPPMRPGGFTLIELLVVVTIIAILAGLLLPVIAMVRGTANTANCMSNMRQIGLFTENYASDHSGYYPPATLEANRIYPWLPQPANAIHGWTAHNEWWHSWIYYLEPYLTNEQKNPWGASVIGGKGGVMICPGHWFRPTITTKTAAENNDWAILTSYGMNVACLEANTGGGIRNLEPGHPGWGVGVDGMMDTRRHQDLFPHPSSTIHIAEHAGTMPDGTLKYKDGITSINEWTNPPNVSWPMSGPNEYVAIPSGSASANPIGLGTWRHNGQTLRVSHRGRSNYLFYDGHIESIKPFDTCGPALDDTDANAMWNGRHPSAR